MGVLYQIGEYAFLTGILDRVVKILTLGAIAFEASAEAFGFSPLESKEMELVSWF